MRHLPQTVVALGVVSFFTDFSSEMIYPMLPIFLSQVLGASVVALGVIEGVAESAASLLKLASGIWTDRLKRRKPFILGGYGLAGVSRPLIGLAPVWPVVLALRLLDRMGKGLRTSPRDALIADVTEPRQRGAAYGLHRAMDHAGAVVGPLVAAALLSLEGISLRLLFLLAAIPAAAVMVVIVLWVKEERSPATVPSEPAAPRARWHTLSPRMRLLLGAIFVFTLGNSTDAFLLLRLKDVGISTASIALIWAFHNMVRMVSTYLGGSLSDRTGRRAMILAGWLFYAGIYLAFGWAGSRLFLVAIFIAYGLYYGLTEPAEKAWVADLAPAGRRGGSFGFYHLAIGVGALPASLLFGFLWHRFGTFVAFTTGAGLALAASLMLLGMPRGEAAAD